MTDIDADVKIDLTPLKKFGDRFQKELSGTASTGPIVAMKKQWAMRYRSFAQLRFDKASKGDGTWPPLKLPQLLEDVAGVQLS